MPKVFFETDNIEIEVTDGTSLQDAVEKADASLPFGCRLGSCGTCRCFVTQGIQNLNEKTDAELELFDTLTSVGVDERLACQCVIHGDVVIKA